MNRPTGTDWILFAAIVVALPFAMLWLGAVCTIKLLAQMAGLEEE